MKRHESVTRHYLVARMPVIVRIDGRAFHTFTSGLNKPFDKALIDTMVSAASAVMSDMQGCKLAYIQSDEASFLLTDYETIDTQAWFGNNLSKIISLSASVMTAAFNRMWREISSDYDAMDRKPAHFDARAFNVPKEDIANYFLWRAKDWARNSIQMYASSFFSHKQLHKKNASDMHEMLHEIGKNWATDLRPIEKNGTFLVKAVGTIGIRNDVLPDYPSVAALVEPFVYPKLIVGGD